MLRPKDWDESKFQHCVKPGAKLWLLDAASAQREDPEGLHASGLESGALNHPVIVVSHEGTGKFGICLVGPPMLLSAVLTGFEMTSKDSGSGKIAITENSAFRKEDNGSLSEPLRLVSQARNPMEYSYLDTSKAYVVTLKMLEPLSREPAMLDARSFEKLQERTATLIEAFDGMIHRKGMDEDVRILNDRKSRYQQITTFALRGTWPRRGSLVRYGRSRDSGIQKLESICQPCPNGVFLVHNMTHPVHRGIVWAYPVRIPPFCSSACLGPGWLITI